MNYRFDKPTMRVTGLALLVGLLLAPVALWTHLFSAPAADAPIYADALSAGWADWSWDTTTDPDSTTPVHSGGKAYAVQHTAAWGGFYLHADPAMSTAGYTHLRFWLHGGATGGQQIQIVLNEDGTKVVPITAQANTWTQVDLPLADFGDPATLTAIYWQDVTGGAQDTYYLDDISLVNANQPTPTLTATPTDGPTPTPTAMNTPGTLPPADIDLTVDVSAARKPISDYIYGMHYVADEAFVQEIALPLRRWGGNIASRYNWQLGTTNHASDWFFHNNNTYDAITGAPMTADQWLQRNKRTNTASLLTIPMLGYVAKDGDQHTCSFPVVTYPNQDDVDDESGFPDCGNGLRNGVRLQADPLTTSQAVDESFAQGWLTDLQANAATNGTVTLFDLDNEPDIWFETHRDVYPVGWKYDEFRDLTYRYAAAIKSTNPNAKLLGPVVNGWTYYWHGSWDGQRQDWATPDDRDAHGGMPFVPWYLQQMKAYEDQNGVRLLDYLDLHYYPQSEGVSLSPAGNAATQALRLRSTRSLWDPTYADESWIPEAGPEGGIIQLLPRMRAWVDQYYPGTKLAITEYNWGGLEHINGALAQADVLGIFGREGLDLATFFDPGQGDDLQTTFPSSPGAYAFRLYRNYDGQGSKFGETSVQATSTDQSQVAVYAAQRSNDNSLTVIVINKTGGALTANLTLLHLADANLGLASAAQRYQYSADDLQAIVHLADLPVNGSAVAATFPANSLTLLRLPTISAGPDKPDFGTAKLYLPLVKR